MRIKELFNNKKADKKKFLKRSVSKNYGVAQFKEDIFGDEEMTPHAEMNRALEIYETRPLVNSGIRQLARFIIGDKVKAVSKSKKSANFVNAWISKRPTLKITFEHAVTLAIVTGNLYIEPLFKKDERFRKLDNITYFPDSSKVIINLYENANPENYYLIEVPTTVQEFLDRPTNYYQVVYFYGDRVFKDSVWAVSFPKSKFYHLKFGYSRNFLYGRSYLSSVINDADALSEILKNIAIIARYRAMNSKIIMPASDQQEILEDDLDFMRDQFENLKDGEHIFSNKQVQITDFSNSGQYDTLISEVDFLRKEIGSGLVPNFITPFNSEVNRATAGEAKIPFLLEIEYAQTIFEEFFTKIIVGELKKSYPSIISSDTMIKFGNVDLESRESKVNYGRDLYSAGVITLNEYRELAGLEPVKNGNKFNWQIMAPEDSGMALMNSIKNVVKKQNEELQKKTERDL